jgi:hypothetical protein
MEFENLELYIIHVTYLLANKIDTIIPTLQLNLVHEEWDELAACIWCKSQWGCVLYATSVARKKEFLSEDLLHMKVLFFLFSFFLDF